MTITSELSNQATDLGLQFNVKKTKIMEVGKDWSGEGISINGEDIEIVKDFCYLGSFISDNSNCDKEILLRLVKVNSIFGRLGKIWANKGLSNVNKFRLYEALVLSTLIYGLETWPMTGAKMKRIEAAHHKWHRKILRINWKEMVTEMSVRALSGQMKLYITLRQRRLRWLGHVHCMDAERIPRQAMEWRPNGKRGRGHSGTVDRRPTSVEKPYCPIHCARDVLSD